MGRLVLKLSNDSMFTTKRGFTLIFGKNAKVYFFGSNLM